MIKIPRSHQTEYLSHKLVERVKEQLSVRKHERLYEKFRGKDKVHRGWVQYVKRFEHINCRGYGETSRLSSTLWRVHA